VNHTNFHSSTSTPPPPLLYTPLTSPLTSHTHHHSLLTTHHHSLPTTHFPLKPHISHVTPPLYLAHNLRLKHDTPALHSRTRVLVYSTCWQLCLSCHSTQPIPFFDARKRVRRARHRKSARMTSRQLNRCCAPHPAIRRSGPTIRRTSACRAFRHMTWILTYAPLIGLIILTPLLPPYSHSHSLIFY
jgi:hypothetical protein